MQLVTVSYSKKFVPQIEVHIFSLSSSVTPILEISLDVFNFLEYISSEHLRSI